MADIKNTTIDGTTYDFKDAKAREDVSDLKEDFFSIYAKKNLKKTVTDDSVDFSEPNISNVSFYTEAEAYVYGVNRFNIATASFSHDGYSSTVITKTDTGISIYYPGGGTAKSAFVTYTAEFDGDLWLSCKASTKGNIRDLRFNVALNGTVCAQCWGQGLLKQKVTVSAGDTVQLRFLMRNQENTPNTVVYDDIMISYIDSEYVPFNDYTNKSYEVNYVLPTSFSAWSASTPAGGVSGINVFIMNTIMPTGLPLPSDIYTVPSGVSVNGLNLVTYAQAYNGTEGVGISTSGKVMLYVSGCSTIQNYVDWLEEHPVTITYDGTTATILPFDGSYREFRQGEKIEFDDPVSVTYYYSNSKTNARHKMVCFGDSITGMYGFSTDYPSMISMSSDIDAINCGFSGSCWTDYPNNPNLMPFSINRLIDSVVAEDFTLQDNAIGSVSVQWFAEHLANIKAIDWSEVEYATFLAGVNDWYYGSTKLYSEDDTSTTNKQRTNIEDCVAYCITQLLTKYPHLKVIVLTPYHAYMQDVDSDTTPNANGNYLYEYAEVIDKCAKDRRVPCENQYVSSGVNQLTMYYYTSDGTHPNEPMKHMIASRFINLANSILAV